MPTHYAMANKVMNHGVGRVGLPVKGPLTAVEKKTDADGDWTKGGIVIPAGEFLTIDSDTALEILYGSEAEVDAIVAANSATGEKCGAERPFEREAEVASYYCYRTA